MLSQLLAGKLDYKFLRTRHTKCFSLNARKEIFENSSIVNSMHVTSLMFRMGEDDPTLRSNTSRHFPMSPLSSSEANTASVRVVSYTP